jgi:hypothetical protein
MLHEAYREEVASAGAEHRMSLRALACVGLAEIASGARNPGLADLSAAAAGYERALGAAAAETQLFTFLLLEQTAGSDSAPRDIAQRIDALAADRLAQAAPWEDWRPRLAQLRARVYRASSHRPRA